MSMLQPEKAQNPFSNVMFKMLSINERQIIKRKLANDIGKKLKDAVLNYVKTHFLIDINIILIKNVIILGV